MSKLMKRKTPCEGGEFCFMIPKFEVEENKENFENKNANEIL